MAEVLEEHEIAETRYPYTATRYRHRYEGEVWIVYRGNKFVHKLWDGSVPFDEVLEDVRAIDRKEMKGSVEGAHDREGRGPRRKRARDIGKEKG